MKATEIEQLLPLVFQRTVEPGGPLAALLSVMEQLHERPEQILRSLDETFNPRRTPDAFVPYLAAWVDLERVFEPRRQLAGPGQAPRAISTGSGYLRELTARAAWLSKRRGTAEGLLTFLRLATGEPGFRLVENQGLDGQPRRYHIIVYAPGRLAAHRPLLERIIASEKPAYVTADLVLEPTAPPGAEK